MSINVNKSSCIRIGPRYNVKCKPLSTAQNGEVIWACTLRYLGVYIDVGPYHVLLVAHCITKKSFYRAFNCTVFMEKMDA